MMEDVKCIDKLMLFGLTRQEAVLYLCLIQNGGMTGYEAAKHTGISRSNVYSALAGLAAQGAAYIVEGNPSRYTAVALEEFCENRIHGMEQAMDFLKMNVPMPKLSQEGYVTIAGEEHIHNKILHMLRGAKKRVYLSAPYSVVESYTGLLRELLDREIKVVLICEQCPRELSGALFYRTPKREVQSAEQIRLIIDSAYVLTGDVSRRSSDTCLYSDQHNFVNVFKEAMHNEIKLIELSEKV